MTKPIFEYWAMPEQAGTKQEIPPSTITLAHLLSGLYLPTEALTSCSTVIMTALFSLF